MSASIMPLDAIAPGYGHLAGVDQVEPAVLHHLRIGLHVLELRVQQAPPHLGRLFRLAGAQQLILDGHTVTAAAQRSGFGNDENLRRVFERRLHVTPTEYRARFASTFRRR
ncbi:MAG: AraC family transcriptional regulator [Propionibacterium sp.]|nr:AraC family transcriptional regulator [Propionibacterium sp.]